jgi:hypothetical protein
VLNLVSHIKGKHRVRGGSEKRVLSRIFIPERDEIIGGRRQLHDEKLQNLYSSSNII